MIPFQFGGPGGSRTVRVGVPVLERAEMEPYAFFLGRTVLVHDGCLWVAPSDPGRQVSGRLSWSILAAGGAAAPDTVAGRCVALCEGRMLFRTRGPVSVHETFPKPTTPRGRDASWHDEDSADTPDEAPATFMARDGEAASRWRQRMGLDPTPRFHGPAPDLVSDAPVRDDLVDRAIEAEAVSLSRLLDFQGRTRADCVKAAATLRRALEDRFPWTAAGNAYGLPHPRPAWDCDIPSAAPLLATLLGLRLEGPIADVLEYRVGLLRERIAVSADPSSYPTPGDEADLNAIGAAFP